ncbi:hypothetical protein FI667_g4121, partial [Globisporangium splendens]
MWRWMQAIKHHEQGKKHKEFVEETLKQKRKAKSEAYHSERDLQDQLRAIEEAAQAKYAQDMARSGVPPPPPPRRGGQAPPPPPRHAGAHGKRAQNARGNAQEEEEHTEEESKEEDHGIYAIRGEVFLEGKRHEDKLETGSACQIWVEELDEWLDALIEKTVVHTIPNTDLSFRRFTITYMAPGVPQPTTEAEVRSDRLRIKMPAGMTLETAQRMILNLQNGGTTTAEEAVKAQVIVDEETGMGEWSTVVVREIDESEEAIAQREAEAQAETDKIAEEEKRREALEDFSSQGDNALGAFNPWGGSYKGVQIDKDLTEIKRAREEEIMITTNGSVGFKKRKKANSGKKQKRIRSEDDG